MWRDPGTSQDGIGLQRYSPYARVLYLIRRNGLCEPFWLDDGGSRRTSGAHVWRIMAALLYGEKRLAGSRRTYKRPAIEVRRMLLLQHSWK
jgi:hypothetical protein